MSRLFRLISLFLTLCLLLPASLGCRDALGERPDGGLPPDEEGPDCGGVIEDDVWTRADAQQSVTDFLTLHGRTYMEDAALQLFWTYSGFSLRFDGTGVRALLTTSTTNPSFYGFLNVYVDGALAPANTVCVSDQGVYTLIDELDAGVHTIEVRKRNEAIYGESATIGVCELTVTDGQFITQAPNEPSLRIEFIGDSITSGFGNMVTDGSGALFSTPTEDGTMTYATLTGRALGADVHVLSRSGICYVTGSDRDSIYDHYTLTASLPGHANDTDAWDFEAEPNDIVVINLGSNDSGAAIDGKNITSAQMTEQAVKFIQMVRSANPTAEIVWAYGMMDQGRKDALAQAVQKVRAAGDKRVHFITLPLQNTAQNGVGVHGHPTVQSHVAAARTLTEYLGGLLGQAIDGRVLLEAQIRCIKEYRLADAAAYEPASYASYMNQLAAAEDLVRQSDVLSFQAYCDRIKALREGVESLVSIDEVSDEYIVIDTCDEADGWALNGDSAGVDTNHHLWGKGCFTTTGTGDLRVNFIRDTKAYGIDLPDDWAEWYLEAWIYVEYPVSFPGGSDFELSQAVDSVEVSYGLDSLSLKQGWNHLVIPIRAARGTRVDQFETLNYVRIFWRNLSEVITFRVDDITLSKGRYAKDRSHLEAYVQEALRVLEYDTSNSEEILEALDFAEKATTRRSVDLAAQKLAELLQK